MIFCSTVDNASETASTKKLRRLPPRGVMRPNDRSGGSVAKLSIANFREHMSAIMHFLPHKTVVISHHQLLRPLAELRSPSAHIERPATRSGQQHEDCAHQHRPIGARLVSEAQETIAIEVAEAEYPPVAA